MKEKIIANKTNGHIDIAQRPKDIIKDRQISNCLKDFLASEDWQAAKNSYAQSQKEGIPDNRIEDYIAGFVFEQTAFRWLRRQSQQRLLLSPKQTREVYYRLRSDHIQENKNPFFGGLKGVSIPDGIILNYDNNTLFITGVVEYTARNLNISNVNRMLNLTPQWFNKDIEKLKQENTKNSIVEYLRKEYPTLQIHSVERTGSISTVLVFPSDTYLPLPLRENTRLVFCPLTRDELGKIVRLVLYKLN